MLSLITRRLVARLPTASLTIARVGVLIPSIQSQTRLNGRTFLTGSPVLAFPDIAKKSKAAVSGRKSTATGAKRTAAKKPAAKKTATKAKGKPKKKVTATKKKAVVKKKPVKPTYPKITKADLPPSIPGSAYVFFYKKYFKSLPTESKPKNSIELIQCAKDAGHLWGSYTDAEKAPYREQERAAKAAYEVEREAYWKSLDPKTLTEINRRRRVKGKSPIKRFTKPEDRRPLSSFLRYVEDFRNSPAAEAIKNGTTRGPAAMNAIAQTAGMNWRAMSDADKAKYVEAANKDLAAWKIKHPKA